MNENKKGLIALIGLIVIVAFIFVLNVFNAQSSKEIYEKFEEAFNNKENTLIMIGSPACSYCNLLKPSLDEMTERYDFKYVYINTEKMVSKYLKLIAQKLDEEEVKTPYLVVAKDNKIVDAQKGYVDYDKLFDFLKENEVIKKDASLALNYIDLEEYQNLLKGDKPSIVVVGQSTCHYCVDAKLVLNKIADENEITINYLNVTYLSEEEGKTFQNSLDYFKDEWGTPVTLILKDGKLVASLEGLKTKEQYETFFKEKGAM